jgi:AcrR family transcriptional regulator
MSEAQSDTKKKIIEAASYLFGVKGFDGTSTREIGRRAGVNISSLNYHFKSKQNLMEEVAFFACEEFKVKIHNVASNPELKSTSDFALSLYDALLDDGQKCLNEFKLFLDAKSIPGDLGDTPMGYNELNGFLKKELHANVPEHEYLYLNNVVFSYLVHSAILSMAFVGQQYVERFLPEKKASTKIYLKQLVETLIKDLNTRYAA